MSVCRQDARTSRYRSNSCKPGPRDMNDSLGSRNQIKRKILLEEKKKYCLPSIRSDNVKGYRGSGSKQEKERDLASDYP
uniref:SFRICE_036187 n=1 Tax=Spodoptera frugiperda TaxID=7108 RepID=A0A2H1WJL5_SPOFR